jgi:hypothetical protein
MKISQTRNSILVAADFANGDPRKWIVLRQGKERSWIEFDTLEEAQACATGLDEPYLIRPLTFSTKPEFEELEALSGTFQETGYKEYSFLAGTVFPNAVLVIVKGKKVTNQSGQLSAPRISAPADRESEDKAEAKDVNSPDYFKDNAKVQDDSKRAGDWSIAYGPIDEPGAEAEQMED